MERGAPRSSLDRGYLAGLAGVLTLEAAGVVYQLLTGIPVPIVTVAATVLVVACMLRAHGLWGTMAFLVLVLAIPFGSEFLGVLTGFPYGTYAYTSLVGPRVFGMVPVFIFIAWIHIAYLAIATTTLTFGRSSVWLAPLDGLLAVAWDAMVDPLAARAGFWSWQAQGGFYGVPLSNFAGWFLVVTLLSVLARAVWSRDARAPAGTPGSVAAILPALLLGSAASFGVLAWAAGFVFAATLGMGSLILASAAAWTRIARSARGGMAPNPWTPLRRPTVARRAADRT